MGWGYDHIFMTGVVNPCLNQCYHRSSNDHDLYDKHLGTRTRPHPADLVRCTMIDGVQCWSSATNLLGIVTHSYQCNYLLLLARVCFWDGDFPVSPSKYIHFFAWFGVDHTIFKHFFIFSEMHNVNFEVEIYMLYAIAICYFILYYLVLSYLVFSCLILSYCYSYSFFWHH